MTAWYNCSMSNLPSIRISRKALIIPVNSNNEILIQDRRNIVKEISLDWGYFGGGIEQNETAEQAVIRETEEELSIRLSPSDLIYFGKFDGFLTPVREVKRDVYLWFMKDVKLTDLSLQEGQGMAFKTPREASMLMSSNEDRNIALAVEKYILNK